MSWIICKATAEGAAREAAPDDDRAGGVPPGKPGLILRNVKWRAATSASLQEVLVSLLAHTTVNGRRPDRGLGQDYREGAFDALDELPRRERIIISDACKRGEGGLDRPRGPFQPPC